MPRLVITGGGGFVAGSVIHQAGADWEVHALSGKQPLAHRPGLVWHTLDLKQSADVRRAFDAIAPHVVIHAAAIGDIDFCENHPEAAGVVNVGMTESVVECCDRHHARLVYCSSDNVFDGTRGNYVEEDRPAPINEYARTKAASEAMISAGIADAVIARVALVMGFGLLGGGNSFLERTVPMLREGRTIYVPPEEIRTPIDVVTLGRALLELAASDFRGLLHLAGNEALDRVTLTRRLAERLGFSPDTVVPRSPTQIAGRARRPRDVSLNNAKARGLLKTPLRDFDASIDLIST
ncbi:MAG TPA: SDR family oxidoreductase [Planctomycetaceae bacterium]|jgi:dTDP-4-dehydrorhamnose reductase|nr:SDR family oxidoreductase [Planctomycetaceae bacterium]